MSTTFAQAKLAVAEIVGKVYAGTSTGGNATTLVDAGRAEPDDLFTNGTIWVLTGNNAGKSRKITDWDVLTHTFTFATMTLLNAAGNLYKAIEFAFPMEDIENAINLAYTSLYRVPTLYTKTAAPAFVTVAGQEAYDLPTGVFDVRRVEIATSEDSPYDFQVHYHWRELNNDIMFDTGFEPQADDLLIRLTYAGRPTALTADTDILNDLIHIDRLKWEAAVWLLNWKKERTQDAKWTELLNYALVKQEQMQKLWPVPNMPRDPHHAGW